MNGSAVPGRKRVRSEFPYVGPPYTNEEQTGVSPVTGRRNSAMG